MALTELQKKLRKQYADEMRKAKNTKKQREIMIKYRKLQFEAEAKKQGMSVAELKKKKGDTLKNMALGMMPFGLGPLGTGLKAGAKLISGALKGAKATKKVTKGTGAKLKPRNKEQAAIKKRLDKKKAAAQKKVDTKKATTPKKESLATRAKKLAVATTGKGGTKGRRSGLAIRDKKTGRLSGISKKTQRTGKNIRTGIAIGVPTVIAGVSVGKLMKGKDDKALATLPKKRPTKKKDFGMGRVDDFGKGRRKGDMEGGTAPIKPKAKAKPTPKMKEMPKKKGKNITAGPNVGFGPKGNIFPKDAAQRRELMSKYGGTGSAAAKAAAQGKQGTLKKVRT
jgi:hypothetical protein